MIPLHLFRDDPMPPTSPRPQPRHRGMDDLLRYWGFTIVSRPEHGPPTWRAVSGEVLEEADAVKVARGMARIDERTAR